MLKTIAFRILTGLIIIVALFAVLAVVLGPRAVAQAPAAVAIKRAPGQVIPFFACGAGADLENLGTNYQVRQLGWEATTRRTFSPKLLQFWGGRAPAGSRVIFHLPFGRSGSATGPDAEMPFDGLDRARDAGLTKVADTRELNRSLRAIQMQFGCEIDIYLGTVDHGHEAQWSSLSPAEFGAKVEEQLAPFTGIWNLRIMLDAGAVRGISSNSWQVRNAIARMGPPEMRMKAGTEPLPERGIGECWANDPGVDFLVTSQLLGTSYPNWAVPRDQVRGRIIVLDNTNISDERVVALLADGYDVALGMYQPKLTHAQWTAAVAAIGE